MTSVKTNKSVSKRFRITKSGKVLYRPRPQNHFRAKQTANTKRDARGGQEQIFETFSKKIKNELLPYS